MTTATPILDQSYRQNWIISRWADFVLIIAAPILWFFWAVVFNQAFGQQTVMGIFLGFNVGHHLPTFIRIYGDQDLLKRFRYSLLLGPLLPFSAAIAISSYVLLNDRPLNNIMFVLVILVIWDPWHFLMQHFGFMRIYDRNNHAPRKLAGRMDLAISAAWFIFVLVSATAWLPNLLYTLYNFHSLPLARVFSDGRYAVVEAASLLVAVGVTVVYLGYLIWCVRKGFYVSPAKLLILVITMGMLYLTYVPNALMERAVPGWTFSLGFAALGMVHVTQYLAIVWKYNRGLATHPERARAGAFQRLFAKGGMLVGVGYVLVCLLYGFSMAGPGNPVIAPVLRPLVDLSQHQWLLAVLMSMSFTSTLMHYYYDGFIWKIRHRENQQNLELGKATVEEPVPDQVTTQPQTEDVSWWDTARRSDMFAVLSRQFLYFGIPILVLGGTFWLHTTAEARSTPIGSLTPNQTRAQMEASLSAIERQMEIEEAMIGIRPRAQHYTYLAELVYSKSVLDIRLNLLAGMTPQQAVRDHADNLERSIALMQRALALPTPYEHPERRGWSREDFESELAEWKQMLAESQAE